jgi:hypothetical protein
LPVAYGLLKGMGSVFMVDLTRTALCQTASCADRTHIYRELAGSQQGYFSGRDGRQSHAAELAVCRVQQPRSQ